MNPSHKLKSRAQRELRKSEKRAQNALTAPETEVQQQQQPEVPSACAELFKPSLVRQQSAPSSSSNADDAADTAVPSLLSDAALSSTPQSNATTEATPPQPSSSSASDGKADVAASDPSETKMQEGTDAKLEKSAGTTDGIELPFASLKLMDLNPEDREAVLYLKSVATAFEVMYANVGRSSKKWHSLALKRHNELGRGFVVVYIHNIEDALRNGPGKDDVSYMPYDRAEAQVKRAKMDKNAVQVVIAPELAHFVRNYDPQTEFVLQIMVVLMPAKDQKEMKEAKEAKSKQQSDATLPSVATAAAWKEHTPKLMSKQFLVARKTELTYNDELQNVLQRERLAKAMYAQENSNSSSQPMETNADKKEDAMKK